MIYEVKENGIILKGVNCLDIELSAFCGQAFRWSKTEEGFIKGTVKGKTAVIEKNDEGYFFHSCSENEFKEVWFEYFDLGTDYAEICEKISPDESIKKAVENTAFYMCGLFLADEEQFRCSGFVKIDGESFLSKHVHLVPGIRVR